MTWISLDIPEETVELAEWLEQQLMGLDLTLLVEELQVIHGDDSASDLEERLGQRLDDVLQHGLTSLPPDELSHLLKHPQLLLALQERVCLEGGDYWQTVAISNDLRNEVVAGREVLNEQQVERRPRPVWRFPAVLVALATAAVVMIIVLRPPDQLTKSGWGWDRPGALATNLPADEYLLSLAESAEEWFNKTPETISELDERLGDFRRGCDTLLAAEHAPLRAEDRQWLLEKCRAWADKLDLQRQELASQDLPAALANANTTIRKLVAALRRRAEQA